MLRKSCSLPLGLCLVLKKINQISVFYSTEPLKNKNEGLIQAAGLAAAPGRRNTVLTKGDAVDPLRVISRLLGSTSEIARAIAAREELNISATVVVDDRGLGLGEAVAPAGALWNGEVSVLGVVVVLDPDLVDGKRDLGVAECGQEDD